jgi:NmrA-like family
LTRAGSKQVPTGVTTVNVDYSDEDSLVSALKGQHFLIITLSVRAPGDVQTTLAKAAAKAGVPFVMPNAYGNDIYNPGLTADIPTYKDVHDRVEALRTIGPAIIPVVCGFWYEYSLAVGEITFGFDVRGRKAVFFDQGTTQINVSTWKQCGRAVAAMLRLPIDGLTDWTRDHKALCISSFKVSQRDMLDSLHRVLGTSDHDWTITHESSKDRWERGMQEMKEGKFEGLPRAMYSRVFYPSGDGIFETQQDNEKLGLPRENLDEATKRTVDMVASGWNPFA